METLKVNVFVSQADAIANSATQWGKTYVVPTIEELAGLSPAQRGYLSRIVENNFVISVARPSWDLVVERINNKITKDIETRALEIAAVTSDLEKLASFSSKAYSVSAEGGTYGHISIETPEIAEALERHAEEIASLRAQKAAKEAADKAARFESEVADAIRFVKANPRRHLSCSRNVAEDPRVIESTAKAEAAAKAKEEAEAAVAEALREWASTADCLPANIRRAAADGYDVRSSITAWAAACALVDVATILPADDYCSFETRDRVPSQEAYQIRDAVEAAIPLIVAAIPFPKAVQVELSGFGKLDVTPHERSTEWRAGFEVTVRHPWLEGGSFAMAVLTEPLERDSEEEEE